MINPNKPVGREIYKEINKRWSECDCLGMDHDNSFECFRDHTATVLEELFPEVPTADDNDSNNQ